MSDPSNLVKAPDRPLVRMSWTTIRSHPPQTRTAGRDSQIVLIDGRGGYGG